MNRLVPLLAVVLLGLSLTVYQTTSREASGVEEVLQQYSVAVQEEYTITDQSTDTINDARITRLTGENGGKEIHVTVLPNSSPAFAATYIQQKTAEITSLYTATPAPYSGIPEREAPCNTAQQPRKSIKSTQTYNRTSYNLYADEGKQYVCNATESTYTVTTTTLYCKETDTLIHTEELIPLQKNGNRSGAYIRCIER